MKRNVLWILIAICGCVFAGCSAIAGGKTDIAKDDGSIQIGDIVLAPDNLLAKEGKARFDRLMAAVVGRVENGKAKVHYIKSISEGRSYRFDSANKAAEYDLADLIKVPPTSEKSESFKPGDKIYALSDYESGVEWRAAEISRIEKNTVSAFYASYSKEPVTLNDAFDLRNGKAAIIHLPERFISKLEADVQDADFYTASRQHRLVPLDDYQPKIGDEVLGIGIGGYFVGKVKNTVGTTAETGGVTRDGTKVVSHAHIWLEYQSNGSAREEKSTEYVPVTALKNPPPVEIGEYVTVKAEDPKAWKYAVVTAVNANDLTVKVDGAEEKTVMKGDYYPLKRSVK